MTDLAVIMSVYHNDRLTFVKEAVKSVLDQTFSKFHFYIIFDGFVPSDIDNYVTSIKDDRIRFYRLKKNEGLAKALNFLLEIVLKNTDYKFIARMDADDVSMPSRFEKQHNFLLKNKEISVLGCWYEEIDELGNHLSYRRLPTDHESLKKRYIMLTPFAHPSVMFRRQLIEKAGFYPDDTVLMEDNVLWGKSLKEGLRFANVPEFLIKFRIDNKYFKRRSGIKYGWNYIKMKFRINKLLDTPVYVYFISLGVGIIKMGPFFLHKQLYHLQRNRYWNR